MPDTFRCTPTSGHIWVLPAARQLIRYAHECMNSFHCVHRYSKRRAYLYVVNGSIITSLNAQNARYNCSSQQHCRAQCLLLPASGPISMPRSGAASSLSDSRLVSRPAALRRRVASLSASSTRMTGNDSAITTFHWALRRQTGIERRISRESAGKFLPESA